MTPTPLRASSSSVYAPLLVAVVLAIVLAGCAGGIPQRIYPPTASIQQISVQEDGGWNVALRLQNFSNVGMRIARVEARLDIAGAPAGSVDLQPGVVAPAGSAEILNIELAPSAAARAAVSAALRDRGSVAYRLAGTIHSSEPDRRRDPFEFESALAPVPGLPDTLR